VLGDIISCQGQAHFTSSLPETNKTNSKPEHGNIRHRIAMSSELRSYSWPPRACPTMTLFLPKTRTKVVRGRSEPSVCHRSQGGWKSSYCCPLPVEGEIFFLTFPFIGRDSSSVRNPERARTAPGSGPESPQGFELVGSLFRCDGSLSRGWPCLEPSAQKLFSQVACGYRHNRGQRVGRNGSRVGGATDWRNRLHNFALFFRLFRGF